MTEKVLAWNKACLWVDLQEQWLWSPGRSKAVEPGSMHGGLEATATIKVR